MRDEGKQSGCTICCEACGTAVPAYDVVSYGSIEKGYRELCSGCFNAEVASALGLDCFENVRLHPVVMIDCAGERREFHFRQEGYRRVRRLSHTGDRGAVWLGEETIVDEIKAASKGTTRGAGGPPYTALNVPVPRVRLGRRADKLWQRRMRLLGSMMALDAFEVKAGVPKGYQFQILGEPEDEPLSLLARLVERMRRSLSVKHLDSEHGAQIADQTVCGRIEWDESEDGRVPLLVIDGQEVSWDEFGRMLMSFEGWQFRVAIRDRSEEV